MSKGEVNPVIVALVLVVVLVAVVVGVFVVSTDKSLFFVGTEKVSGEREGFLDYLIRVSGGSSSGGEPGSSSSGGSSSSSSSSGSSSSSSSSSGGGGGAQGLVTCTTQPSEVIEAAWAMSIGGNLADDGRAVTTDSQGNIYVAGTFKGSLTIGDVVLSHTRDYGIFLAKFSSQGEFRWAKSFGSLSGSQLQGWQRLSIDVDDSGNVVLAGDFQSDANIGGLVLSSEGSEDVFLAVYDSNNGNPKWLRRFGGPGSDISTDVKIGSGNIFLTGSFNGESNFGNGKVQSLGEEDIFLGKYSLNDGNTPALWVKDIGGTKSETSPKIDLFSDMVILAFNSRGNLSIGGTNFINSGNDDFIVAKYSISDGSPISDANSLWPRKIGGDGWDKVMDITVDYNGDVVLVGYYSFLGSSSVDFDGQILSPGSNTNPSFYDLFIVKYQGSNGNLRWARAIKGIIGDISSTSAGSNSEIAITGRFQTPADFGGGSMPNTNGFDVFLAIYSSEGNHVFSKGYGDIGTDRVRDMIFDKNGNIILTGDFTYRIDFGNGPVDRSGNNWGDAFLTKFSFSSPQVVDCDDGKECTIDQCINNQCSNPNKPLRDPCSSGKCDGNGNCLGCIDITDCDDGNECTTNTCTAGVCSYPNVRDGSPCNGGNGQCTGGVCSGVVVPAGCSGTAIYETPSGETQCSSYFSSPYQLSHCNNASDRSTSSAWFSNFQSPQPQFISFDLGDKKCISGIKVLPWMRYTDQGVSISVSNDNVTWAEVVSEWNISGFGDDSVFQEKIFPEEVNGRYVKLNFYYFPYTTHIRETKIKTRTFSDVCTRDSNCPSSGYVCEGLKRVNRAYSCVSGACNLLTSSENCNDSNECTLDSCSISGCSHTNVAQGTLCNRGTCQAGRCVPNSCSGTADYVTPFDVNCRSFSSGLSSVSGFPCINMIDKNVRSYWQSHEASDPQMVTFDLGASKCISGVKIYSATNLNQNTSIEISDTGVSWRTIVLTWPISRNEWNDITFPEVTNGRYVRLNFYSTVGDTFVEEAEVKARVYS